MRSCAQGNLPLNKGYLHSSTMHVHIRTHMHTHTHIPVGIYQGHCRTGENQSRITERELREQGARSFGDRVGQRVFLFHQQGYQVLV